MLYRTAKDRTTTEDNWLSGKAKPSMNGLAHDLSKASAKNDSSNEFIGEVD